MTSHLIKPGCDVSKLQLRCGLLVEEASPDALLGTEGSLDSVDCAGCLRDLVFSMRLERLGDTPENRWLAGGDTGVSSKTIWSVMTGRSPGQGHCPSVPYDSRDFGRCHRLLKTFPHWRPRMGKVAEAYPEWSGLVEVWEQLTSIYRVAILEPDNAGLSVLLTKYIRAIRDDGTDAS